MNIQEGTPSLDMDLKLDMDLVEVLADQKKGTEEQQTRLQEIINEIDDKIYRDAIYLLTHEIINDICEAKEAFEDIKNHQNSMTQLLERTVSLQVAALDYMQNIQKVIKHPTIIDSDKYYQFAYNAFLDETTAIYDKKLLHADLDNDSIKQKKNISEKKRVSIKGVPLAPGLASGLVFYYKDIKTRDTEIRFIKENEIDSEIKRIKKAIQQVKQELHMLTNEARREIGNEMAMIFDAHNTLLDDTSLLDEIEIEIKEKRINAENVIKKIFYRIENKFKTSKSLIIQEKALDIRDIGKRIVNFLVGRECNILADIPEKSILFTKHLLPSDIIHIKNRLPVAIITEEGSAYSHSAIIAKTLGIPLLLIKNFEDYHIQEGTRGLVDGKTGLLIINPDESEVNDFTMNISRTDERIHNLAKNTQGKDLILDNNPIKIMANVSSREDIKILLHYGCDGIGLFRIESIYLESHICPTENSLYYQIYQMLEPVHDKEITIRLADFGGDKIIPYLKMDTNVSSMLGLRGVRFLLHHVDLLKTQLKVCLRLSKDFNIKILIPFVTIPEEISTVRNYLEREKINLRDNKIHYRNTIQLGAMIETPAAIFNVDEIVERSDFISIGSNDLLQYIMVADRENQKISAYYEKGHYIIVTIIKNIVAACDKKQIQCSLCGELAADKRFTDTLLEYGLTAFSIRPLFIPELKSHIMHFIKSIT